MGDLAQRRNAPQEAVNFYTQAVQVGDRAETSKVLLKVGLDAAFRGKDPARGVEYLQRARNAARTGDDTGPAMTWIAFLRQADPGGTVEAESIYRAALALETPGSSVQALTYRVAGPPAFFKVEPAYSEAARALKVQGTVLLKVTIDVDGRAKDVQVTKSVGLGLDEKAVEAVTAWRFNAAQLGGEPVAAQAQIEINFRLL